MRGSLNEWRWFFSGLTVAGIVLFIAGMLPVLASDGPGPGMLPFVTTLMLFAGGGPLLTLSVLDWDRKRRQDPR